MSWKKTSEGSSGDKPYAVYQEDMVTVSVSRVGSSFSSEIDFIPPGTDFTVISNTNKTTLSISTHVELWVAFERSAAIAKRVHMYKTPFIPVTGEIQGKMTTFHRDISAEGQYAYYYLKIPGGGDTTEAGAATVNNVIIVGKGSTALLA
jgi:hypothetical protein